MGEDIDRLLGRSLPGYRTASLVSKIRAGPNFVEQSERGWVCRLRIHAGHYTLSLEETTPDSVLAGGLSLLPGVITSFHAPGGSPPTNEREFSSAHGSTGSPPPVEIPFVLSRSKGGGHFRSSPSAALRINSGKQSHQGKYRSLWACGPRNDNRKGLVWVRVIRHLCRWELSSSKNSTQKSPGVSRSSFRSFVFRASQ